MSGYCCHFVLSHKQSWKLNPFQHHSFLLSQTFHYINSLLAKMESSMLSATGFISAQTFSLTDREMGAVVRTNQSSFYGKMICNKLFLRKDIYTHRRFTVTSVFGKKAKKVKRETVVPEPDYRIPVVLLGVAGGLGYTNNLLPAAPIGLLGLLLLFQTTRVRFVFDDEALEVKVGNELEESGDNVFVGGKNRWKYSTFVNWELWWPNFPVLVYFKETQTKPEGQVHFFPVIFNGKQLYDIMVERAGPSKTSGPK